MKHIPPIQEWKRIFIDTSFIIDGMRDIQHINPDNPKFESARKAHALIAYFSLLEQKEQNHTWITSSIVLSELLKFENSDAVSELQGLFRAPNMEIINFTRKEASFLVNDIGNYIEQKYTNQFFKEFQRSLAEQNLFNPKNFISSDARIVACAKSKNCDAVLTSDEKSFLQIAKQVNLPVILTKDLPVDTFLEIDYKTSIQTNY